MVEADATSSEPPFALLAIHSPGVVPLRAATIETAHAATAAFSRRSLARSADPARLLAYGVGFDALCLRILAATLGGGLNDGDLLTILSAVVFNALVIVALVPLALRGVRYRPVGAADGGTAVARVTPAGIPGAPRPWCGVRPG